MAYPQAVLEKAQRLAQLLQRVGAGESLESANEALGFDLNQRELARAQAKYETGGHRWQSLIDGRHGHSRKAHSALREWLYTRREEDESLRAPQLVEEIEAQFGVTLTNGHVNYLLRKRGLSAPPGRPYKGGAKETALDDAPTSTDTVDNAGLFFPRSGKAGDGPSSSD
jgi:transposase